MISDLMLTEDFDLQVANGDLVVGDATFQSQELLILMMPGELRQFPTRGVGVRNYLLEDQAGGLNGAIKRELERDGVQVDRIRKQGETLQISGQYE